MAATLITGKKCKQSNWQLTLKKKKIIVGPIFISVYFKNIKLADFNTADL